MIEKNLIVRTAGVDDIQYASLITSEMEESAKARGTGIAKRSPEYIATKMNVTLKAGATELLLPTAA